MAKDVKMFYIEDDIKKVQTKPNLYLQNYGPEGVFHLGREIFQNSFDECTDQESEGNSIYISYDILSEMVTCEDNGRGFPEKDYPLDIFCTKLQSGSKFNRDQGGNSSGEFGVGMTVVNALSSFFELTSYREKENTKHVITFKDGEKVDDKQTKRGKNDPVHGSRVRFIINKNFLGKNAVMPYKDMIEWFNHMMHFVRKKNLKVKIEIYEGFKCKESYKLKAKPFEELLDKIVTDTKFSPKCSFECDKTIKETIRKSVIDPETQKVKIVEKVLDKEIHMDIALRYCPESITFYDSYCNWRHTVDGGIHQDTFDKCFCSYIQTKAKESMSDAQKEKYPVLWEDIRSGLCCVINLSTDTQVNFVGNAKTKIGNKELIPYFTEMINAELDKFFKEHQNILNEYVKIVRMNAKARVEAAKIKVATQKERINTFKEHEMKNYIRCNNTGKKWKELSIVEGDSASSAARNGCDPDTQAFFLLRGVTANPFKCSLAEIMDPKTGNKEWRELVSIMRCGIGPKFDINKLYFNRINILTDADVDGAFISQGILGFFYLYFRPIIEAGMLYKVFSPLYKLDDKEHPYVANKYEMIKLHQKAISKNYKIKDEFSDKPLNKDDMKEFLEDTYDFRDNLIRLSKNLGNVDKFLVEVIVAQLTILGIINEDGTHEDLQEVFSNKKFIRTFMGRIQKEFPEITLHENEVLSGIVNGRAYSIKISERFIRKSKDLIPVYKKYGYKLHVSEKKRDPKIMTIGQFIDDTLKYTPPILVRYKGLGNPTACRDKTSLIAGKF